MNTRIITEMNGLIIASIGGLEQYSELVTITTVCGRMFNMRHYQDCCESVTLEDFDGDIIGGTVLSFEETTKDVSGTEDAIDDETIWTYYNLYTTEGTLNLRWCGSSNGYYSVDVDFSEEITL